MPRNYCHASQTQCPLPDLSVITAVWPVRRLVQNLIIVKVYYLSVDLQYTEILFYLNSNIIPDVCLPKMFKTPRLSTVL